MSPTGTARDDPGAPVVDLFTIESLTVDVYRAPVTRPVRTSFGSMPDRPAVIVTALSADGIQGYGEVWCNFPEPAAGYRADLITCVLAPAIVGRPWQGPEAVFHHLSEGFRLVGIQAGEPGPFAQCIAGIDIALWDMAARRARLPLWRFLGGSGSGRVPAYASGIGPENPAGQAAAARAQGHRAFKLKVGFGKRRDLASLDRMRSELGRGTTIAVDANQAWSPGEARSMIRSLAPYAPAWLEEPIPADRPDADWRNLADGSPIPLAGGENLVGEAAFDTAIETGALAVIQPDVTKWGGISGCLPVAGRVLAAGRRYCPHHLGAGIGVLASAHLLAAAGGDGLLEVDCNPNPLRKGLAQPFPRLIDGRLFLSDAPGLGVTPDDAVSGLRVDGNR
ncbi:MAG: mandelate racemase/muconate lactonizing enzyme family protein [Acidimicrobiia bacterium]|nr:mandelate racemase/muconate lactonizing enzyme family protein [Acidimicrobiia bacterium]MYC84678.1 mandelate racemase/muconate lactonizing enzyme family protein [Acidimicrobiia bacterium]